MGRRKQKKRIIKKKKPTVPKVFDCPFCNHHKTVECKMNVHLGVGLISCHLCNAKYFLRFVLTLLRYQKSLTDLLKPIDIYAEWIDKCEEKNIAALALSKEKRSIDFSSNPPIKKQKITEEGDISEILSRSKEISERSKRLDAKYEKVTKDQEDDEDESEEDEEYSEFDEDEDESDNENENEILEELSDIKAEQAELYESTESSEKDQSKEKDISMNENNSNIHDNISSNLHSSIELKPVVDNSESNSVTNEHLTTNSIPSDPPDTPIPITKLHVIDDEED